MDRTLSVLLPVCNAQATLAATVAEVLEVVSELTDQFELLIVDDGSEDATSEIACELSRSYPQVRAICHSRPRGRRAALRSALEHTRGQTVLICDEQGDLGLDELARQWRQLAQAQHLPAPPEQPPAPPMAPNCTVGRARPRFRIADPQTLSQASSCASLKRPNYLERIKAFALGE